jgi:hypothetical protein
MNLEEIKQTYLPTIEQWCKVSDCGIKKEDILNDMDKIIKRLPILEYSTSDKIKSLRIVTNHKTSNIEKEINDQLNNDNNIIGIIETFTPKKKTKDRVEGFITSVYETPKYEESIQEDIQEDILTPKQLYYEKIAQIRTYAIRILVNAEYIKITNTPQLYADKKTNFQFKEGDRVFILSEWEKTEVIKETPSWINNEVKTLSVEEFNKIQKEKENIKKEVKYSSSFTSKEQYENFNKKWSNIDDCFLF